ncbi:MAG: ATP-dependent DNA helicase RecG [Patescibacteria group bacterium]|nr:ATP-dependent DNA helicase RecG [Patescibacteria group bacterium]
MLIKLNTPLEELMGVGPGLLSKLKKLGLGNVHDLLYHFPTRYEDWSEVVQISTLKPGDTNTIQATVKEINVRRAWKRRRMFIVEALLADSSGSIAAVWFNQTYIKNTLRPGVIANFSGKAALRKQNIYLSNPVYEVVGRENENVIEYGESQPTIKANTKHTARLVPIYPETKGLTSRGLRYLIQPTLEELEPQEDFLPTDVLTQNDFPELDAALRAIHFPQFLEEARKARNRFSFEELFLMQLKVLGDKLALAREKTNSIKPDAKTLKEVTARLPFQLTPSQGTSLKEIIDDLSKDRPMNRLLQGDVGSGKTVIAGIAAYLTATQGLQIAFMAPTEILARQHYATLKKLFPEFKRGLGLILSKETRVYYGDELETEFKKAQFVANVATGQVAIAVGTHALIEKGVVFDNLGLVIVDEQHRFGVKQRAALIKSNRDGVIPHFLSMSATPIPRTLMMTIFGDLDLSIISELPSGRISKIVAPENRAKAYAFIRGQVRKGRQGFVVCPRIDSEVSDSENKMASKWDEVKAVKDEYNKLKHHVFPDLRVGMIHGKLKTAEKAMVMKNFTEGQLDLIVSTSVVEVGVDIPNATIMIIEDADRFGLAQIYQLRGRVGRGEHQSFCFLFTESQSETILKRLRAVLTAKNGFELAEMDLELRGPGEFLGSEQSGMPDIAMRGLQHPTLVKNARAAAEKLLAEDPSLERHPLLRSKVDDLAVLLHLE